MYGGSAGTGGGERDTERGEFGGPEELGFENLRLGQDVRFLFVAVGGGGIRVGREVARRHPRYVETIAIHCDASVQGMEEFDRRITLEPHTGDDPDGPAAAGSLARAAEPALERIFDGAAFVTIVGSLGGTAGSGLFPSVVDAASRAAVVVSVFAIKPFAAEAERRGLADRTLGRLPFLEAFVEKQQRGGGRLAILDNEALAQRAPKMAFNGVARHWADLLQSYMEREIIHPAEAAVEASRIARVAEHGPMNRPLEEEAHLRPPPEESVPGVPLMPRLLPAATAHPERDAELTFEIVGPTGPEPLR
ncbi:MAG TPA: hypothetical protein VMH90_04500 [Thermoplasmata archaeon]|nr:hypothetical protein [Thermoplasmata archaeon]